MRRSSTRDTTEVSFDSSTIRHRCGQCRSHAAHRSMQSPDPTCPLLTFSVVEQTSHRKGLLAPKHQTMSQISTRRSYQAAYDKRPLTDTGDGVGHVISYCSHEVLENTSRSHFVSFHPQCPTCEQDGFARQYTSSSLTQE